MIYASSLLPHCETIARSVILVYKKGKKYFTPDQSTVVQ